MDSHLTLGPFQVLVKYKIRNIIQIRMAGNICNDWAENIVGVNTVIYTFASPEILTRRHTALKIDNSEVRRDIVQFLQVISPDIAIIDRAVDRSINAFGNALVHGISDVAFIEVRLTRMGQNLINPSSRHHIAT